MLKITHTIFRKVIDLVSVKCFIILFIVHSFSILQAQDSTSINTPKTIGLLVPDIEILVEAAWEKHGMLKSRKEDIISRKEDLKFARRVITRNFGVFGDYRYGNLANFSENVTSASSVSTSNNVTQVNFGVGVYLKIPVFDVYNRKSTIRKAKAEIRKAEALVEQEKFLIKETVIRLYEDLVHKQKILELKAKNLANVRVSMEMAEKEFRRGLIQINQYVSVTDITARVEEGYQNSISDFKLSKKLLENFTGLSFN